MNNYLKILALFSTVFFTFCKAPPSARSSKLNSTRNSIALSNAVEVSSGEEIVASVAQNNCISADPNDRNLIAQLTPKTTDSIFYTPDGPPRVYRDLAGKIRMLVPHHLTYAFTGDSLDKLSLDCTKAVSISNYNSNPAFFDDAFWPWSPYRLSDGRFFVMYHHEAHAKSHPGEISCADNECWFPALTWGSSSDGVRFQVAPQQQRVLAKPPVAFNNHFVGGYSDPTNIIFNPRDNFYYTMSMFKSADGSFGVCTLRTKDLFDSNQWRAFDGNEFNAKPNLGERCATLFGGLAPGSLNFSTYLNQFVFLGFGERQEDHTQGFFIKFSQDLIHWSSAVTVLSATNSWGDNATIEGRVHHIYPSFIDPTGGDNFDTLSQDPYLYYVRRSTPSTTREVVRMRVHFKSNTAEIVSRAAGIYRNDRSAFYSNGQGLYCEISSIDQLRDCGWKNSFDNLPSFPDHGRDVVQKDSRLGARCGCGINLPPPSNADPVPVTPISNTPPAANPPANPAANSPANPPVINQPPTAPIPPAQAQILPRMCYRIGPTGFLSNGAGISCPYTGCKMQELCGTTNFAALPSRSDHAANVVDPNACRGAKIPVGCYRVNGTGYYSNGSGQSCPFLGDKMVKYCGKDLSHFNELPQYCDNAGNDVGPECQG